MLNIYVFIYKRDLEQRGSCVVQRGSSSVENNVGVVKHICFHIQKAPGPAWFLRGSAWFHHSDRDLRNCKTYMFSYTKLSWTGVVPAWFQRGPAWFQGPARKQWTLAPPPAELELSWS